MKVEFQKTPEEQKKAIKEIIDNNPIVIDNLKKLSLSELTSLKSSTIERVNLASEELKKRKIKASNSKGLKEDIVKINLIQQVLTTKEGELFKYLKLPKDNFFWE